MNSDFVRYIKIPNKCSCGGRILPVVYGMTFTLNEDEYYKVYHRRVILAGCCRCIYEGNEEYSDDPVWMCKECGKEYYSRPLHWYRKLIIKIIGLFSR